MNTTKKAICVMLAIMLAVTCLVISGCGAAKSEIKGINTDKATAPVVSGSSAASSFDENATLPSTGYKKPYTGTSTTVEIDVKDYGKITAKLRPDVAPLSVQNFLNLVNEGFYDGLTFHRIIKNFMIQGGDPLGTGMGGSTNQIKGEFSSNGVANNLSHTRGVLSMARSSDPDSGSSQFFIVHKDSIYLDGQYAAFGEVTSGMDVVDTIAEKVKVEDDNGTVSAANQPVINSIKIIE